MNWGVWSFPRRRHYISNKISYGIIVNKFKSLFSNFLWLYVDSYMFDIQLAANKLKSGLRAQRSFRVRLIFYKLTFSHWKKSFPAAL